MVEQREPSFIQSSQSISFVEKLQQMVEKLKTYPEDGRAFDAAPALLYAIERLSAEPYAVGSAAQLAAMTAPTDVTVLAEDAIAQAEPESPGTGADGEPLPPFTPPQFGDDGFA